MKENEITRIAIDICYKIHVKYGPGLFESVYENILCYELDKISLPYERQKSIRLYYDGLDMGVGFIPDIVIDKKVILELKSVETLAEIHYKQLLTYLRISNMRLGLLINFQVSLFKNGIHRIVNRF